MDFKQMIIWGHTHYWIHHAFNRAFKYLKYNTFWVDNKLSSLESIDRTIPSLFLTEGSNCFSYSYSTLRINKNERKRN